MVVEDRSRSLLEQGEPLDQRFIRRQLIASSDSADVYLGFDQEQNKSVAIKHLRPSSGSAGAERLCGQFVAMANLSDPHVVAVLGTGAIEDRPFLAMEYVDGGTLTDLMSGTWGVSHFELGEVARLGAEIAAGLAHAHGRGVVHRNLTPANVLMTADLHPKLTNFALPRAEGDRDPSTFVGFAVATTSYSSPEQLTGQPITPASDLYSLGAILYEMATGRPPFVGTSPVAVARKHVHEDVVPPRWMNSTISPELETIILQTLAKDPAARPDSAEQLQAALEACRVAERDAATAARAALGSGAARLVKAGGASAGSLGAVPDLLARRPRTSTPEWSPPTVHNGSAALARPRRQHRGAAALGALALVGGLGFTGHRLGLLHLAHHDSVPTVAGMTEASATQRILAAGLKVVTRQRPADANLRGIVLTQSPAASATVGKGATVTIVVGVPQSVSMLAVTNIPLTAARAALQHKGLQVVVDSVAPSAPGQSDGLVLAQTPRPGAVVDSGSTVVLEVAKTTKVAVPPVAGLSLLEASVLLNQSGLSVSPKFSNQASATVASGAVISAQPAVGARVLKGSAVRLVLSTGPAPTATTLVTVAVPTLKGERLQRAVREVKADGLRYRVTTESTDQAALDGTVADTSPRSGAAVAPDSVVVITTWSYSAGSAVPAAVGNSGAASSTQSTP